MLTIAGGIAIFFVGLICLRIVVNVAWMAFLHLAGKD